MPKKAKKCGVGKGNGSFKSCCYLSWRRTAMEKLNNGILSGYHFFPLKNGIHISPGPGCLKNGGYLIKTVSSQCCITWLTRRSPPLVINVEHPLHGQQIKGIGHRSFQQRDHSQELVASHGQRFEPSLEWVGDRRRKDKIRAQESPWFWGVEGAFVNLEQMWVRSGGKLGSVCKKTLDTKLNFGVGVLGSRSHWRF